MNSLAVLQHTLDGLPFGVTLWRAESTHPEDLRLVYANALASQEAGVDLKRLVGSLAAGILSAKTPEAAPSSADTTWTEDSKVVSREALTIPRHIYTDAKGRTREYRIHLVPVWDRTVALTYERVGGEAAQQPHPPEQFQDYFEDIVRTLREPLVLLDGALNVAWSNEVFLRTFGLDENIEGRALVDLVASQKSRSALASRLARVLPSDQPIEGEEFELISGDGTLRVCVLNARRLNARDTTAELILVAMEEVTERRQREALQRSFVESLVRARDEERRAIARDLHDRVGQALTSHTVMLQRVENAVDLEVARERAKQLHKRVEELLVDVGNLVARLHPYRLDQLGLVAALRQQLKEFADLHQLKVDFEATGWDADDPGVDRNLEISIYRMVQEALTNVARHAHASLVNVTLHRDPEGIRVLVEDDGCGFDPEVAPNGGGLGLVSLGERARLIGGELTIESTKEGGTTVAVGIPLKSGRGAV